jgi:hypothetical protein
MARSMGTAPRRPRKGRFDRLDPEADNARRELEEQLSAALGVEVKVRLQRAPANAIGAKVEIAFETIDEVRQLLAKLEGTRDR